jgi:hypothetical protein
LDPVGEEQVRRRIAERDKSKRAIPQVLVEIRMKHYEQRRRELFRMIKEVGRGWLLLKRCRRER